MSDFCKACSEEMFDKDYGDLARFCPERSVAKVLCEGCGHIIVNHEGVCISTDCLKKGEPGHGVQYELR